MPLPRFDGDLRPALRPHVRVEQDQVYFLESRRPWIEWTADLANALSVIDGERTIRECNQIAGIDLTEVLEVMWSAGMIELLEAPPTSSRPNILVLEPHMDDAGLSIGGTLYQRRHEVEFTILTMVGRSNFTSYYYLDRDYLNADTVSELRVKESQLFARAIHGRHLELGLSEAPLRYNSEVNWDRDWFRSRRAHVSAFISHVSSQEEEIEWSTALEEHLDSTDYDELWFSLGVGTHTDHDLTRNAVLRLMIRRPDLFTRQPVRFYQDVPYASQFPDHTGQLIEELGRRGLSLKPVTHGIDDVFDEKLRLISIFASQFKIEVLRPGITSCAESASGSDSSLSELFFDVSGRLSHVDQLGLHGDTALIQPIAEKAKRWIERTRERKTLHVLAFTALGRPCEDLRKLQEMFPGVEIKVYVADRHVADAQDLKTGGFCVQVIPRSRLAWLAVAAKLTLRDDALLVLRYPNKGLRGRFLPSILLRTDLLEVHLLSHLLMIHRSRDLDAPVGNTKA